MGDMIPDGYRILMRYNSGTKRFVAAVPELGDVQVEAETRTEALSKAEEAIEQAIRKAAEAGEELPAPMELVEFSGELKIRISPKLHRELAFWAVEDNLEPEQLAAEMISAGTAIKAIGRPAKSGREGRGGGRGGGRGERQEKGGRGRGGRKDYHDIMDDRASFIEYVRSIDADGTQKGHRRGRGQK